jgi:hypothetical protein
VRVVPLNHILSDTACHLLLFLFREGAQPVYETEGILLPGLHELYAAGFLCNAPVNEDGQPQKDVSLSGCLAAVQLMKAGFGK